MEKMQMEVWFFLAKTEWWNSWWRAMTPFYRPRQEMLICLLDLTWSYRTVWVGRDLWRLSNQPLSSKQDHPEDSAWFSLCISEDGDSSTSLDNYVPVFDCSCSKKSFILLFKWNCLHPSFLVLCWVEPHSPQCYLYAFASQFDAFLIFKVGALLFNSQPSNCTLIYSFSPIFSLLRE